MCIDFDTEAYRRNVVVVDCTVSEKGRMSADFHIT